MGNYNKQIIDLSKKGRKRFDSIGEAYGVEHSETAIQWVLGIWKDIDEGTRESRVKDGKFNPHFRIATEDVWVEIKDIDEIYFKMHLFGKGENK